jgi:hypothetical protein
MISTIRESFEVIAQVVAGIVSEISQFELLFDLSHVDRWVFGDTYDVIDVGRQIVVPFVVVGFSPS